MNNKIILAIKPKYVDEILAGIKRYEYRTRVPKNPISTIYIYETAPMKKVVAEVQVIKILALSPNDLWEETQKFSGITKQFFDEYFFDRKIAYAYKLGAIKVYEKPLELENFGLKKAPQSFAYVNMEEN